MVKFFSKSLVYLQGPYLTIVWKWERVYLYIYMILLSMQQQYHAFIFMIWMQLLLLAISPSCGLAIWGPHIMGAAAVKWGLASDWRCLAVFTNGFAQPPSDPITILTLRCNYAISQLFHGTNRWVCCLPHGPHWQHLFKHPSNLPPVWPLSKPWYYPQHPLKHPQAVLPATHHRAPSPPQHPVPTPLPEIVQNGTELILQ